MAELKDFEILKQVDLSEYARKLSASDLAVYMDKLTLETGEILPDPYNVGKGVWINDVKLWPSIAYPDIYHYFVTSSSFYSNTEIKCYKSMDSYNYFICGEVQQVKFHDPNVGNVIYLLAEVLPSQRQGVKKTMYSTYLIVHKDGDNDGQILTAHCTCMAGRGKACSHAAAVAYKVEAALRLGMKEDACTSSLCTWNDMSRKKAQPALLSDIDFKRPKYGEDVRTSSVTRQKEVQASTSVNLASLKKIQPSAVIFSCTDIKQKPELPPTITETVSLLLGENVSQDALLPNLGNNYSNEKINNLEQATLNQSKSNIWHKQRAGRITSSRMHRFFTLKDSTDRKVAVKELLEPTQFSTDSTRYDILNEALARKTYTKFQMHLHGETFVCNESGLMLNSKFPYLGASPDGLVECSCCGKGCLEIKCLKTYEAGLPDPRSDMAKSEKYLITDIFQLKKSHRFYTQVQGHMLICELDYCDLYLWSKSNSFTVRVPRDVEFCTRLLEKMKKEYTDFVIPEIINRIKTQNKT